MEITLTAADGYQLGAALYGSGRPVLIMPATGVPQSYYAKFAAYLAERGFTALSFDYRGIGRSRFTDVRKLAARMRDWALLDGETFVTGVVIGVATIPGSAIAAWLVTRMHAHLHVLFMEGLILIGGASLLWNSWR